MHHLQWCHHHIIYRERLVGSYGMKIESGHSRIEHFIKEIGQALAQVLTSKSVSIDIDITKTTEGTQVIDTARMVIVLVSEQYAIQPVEWHAQHLFAEVGPTVYQYTSLIGLHKQ